MRAAIFDRAGEPEVLHIAELPNPTPGDTDLLIRVEAISIEGGDLLARAKGEPGHVPGYAAAGEVVGMGAAVSGFEVGQKVTSFAFSGSHAELRAAPAATCFPIPDGLDVAIAAAIPVGAGTAAWACKLGGLKSGETVLVTGATGGVGLACVQLAARQGARVLGTGSNPETLAQLHQYGMTDAIVIGEGSVSEQVLERLGDNKVDLLIDNIGGTALIDGLDALADGGRAVLVGAFGGFDQPINPRRLLFRRQTVIGCLFGADMARPEARALVAELLLMAGRGELQVPVDAVFDLSDIVAAHRRAEERGRIGRVIVSV